MVVSLNENMLVIQVNYPGLYFILRNLAIQLGKLDDLPTTELGNVKKAQRKHGEKKLGTTKTKNKVVVILVQRQLLLRPLRQQQLWRSSEVVESRPKQ